jgi:hypothetical protein
MSGNASAVHLALHTGPPACLLAGQMYTFHRFGHLWHFLAVLQAPKRVQGTVPRRAQSERIGDLHVQMVRTVVPGEGQGGGRDGKRQRVSSLSRGNAYGGSPTPLGCRAWEPRLLGHKTGKGVSSPLTPPAGTAWEKIGREEMSPSLTRTQPWSFPRA